MHCNGLKLNVTKKNALVDFLSCLPQMLTKAAKRSNIAHGFVANGLVGDEATHSSEYGFPDFDLMLDTVRQEVTQEEYQLCRSTFSGLFQFQMKNGHAEETEHNRLGFPMDKDPSGQEVSKDHTTVSQESQQRAKCYNHEHQIDNRNERHSLMMAEKERKEADLINKHQKVLQESETCATKIRDVGDNKDALLQRISSCLQPELKSFIHVRMFKTMTGPSRDENWTWPNKGKLEEAKNGVDTLINRAFECVSNPPILEQPESPLSDITKTTKNARHKQATIVSIEVNQSKFSKEDNASSFLQDSMWVHQIIQSFDTENAIKSTDVPQDSLRRADLLQKHLEKRLGRHCQVRIKDEKKRDHLPLEHDVCKQMSTPTVCNHGAVWSCENRPLLLEGR